MQQVSGLEWSLNINSFSSTFLASYPVNLDTIIEIKEKGSNLFNRFVEKVKNIIKEYGGIIKNSVWVFVPSYIRYPLQEILRAQSTLKILEEYSSNSNKSYIDRIKGNARIIGIYLLAAGAGIGAVVGIIFGLHSIHSLPSNHVQYLGSQNGYEAFVPHNTINYHGHTDPIGDLILPNGTTIHNDVIWDGQYANTIIQNHAQIVHLNGEWVGKTDPVNGQPFVSQQDFYVIKGQVPVEQVTINGQTYYVIEANSINPGNIAGFYTYDKWVPNFEVAINTPGTYAAGLPGNSPVFKWTNTTGTVAYQTMVYEQYGLNGAGGAIVVLSNKTIIPYGTFDNIIGSSLKNYIFVQYSYNPSS
jgi:hypothetical protein